MKIITMYRHAESEANVGGISRPNANIELTEKGHAHAKEIADSITEKPSQIYTSEFIRTEQTARALLTKFELTPIKYAGLNEFNTFGYEVVQGLNGQQRMPLALNYWKNADPNNRVGETGETFNEFSQRVKDFIPQLSQLEDRSIIFGHGMWMTHFIWLHIAKKHAENTARNMKKFIRFHSSLEMQNLDKITIISHQNHIYLKRD